MQILENGGITMLEDEALDVWGNDHDFYHGICRVVKVTFDITFESLTACYSLAAL